MSLARIMSILRQVAAVLAIVLGSADVGFPGNIRAILVAVGGVVLVAEHVVAALMDPNTSINITPTTTVEAPAGTPPKA